MGISKTNSVSLMSSISDDYGESHPILTDPFESSKPWSQKMLRTEYLIIIACMIITLVTGAPNAFFLIASGLSVDQGLSGLEITFLTSSILLGIYFTIIGGWAFGRFGTLKTFGVAAFSTCTFYVVMSFTHKSSYWLMILSNLVIGFGSGASFMVALATSIQELPTNPGMAVGLPGTCMSLSLGFTTFYLSVYQDLFDCHEVFCWRNLLLVEGMVTMIFFVVAAFLIMGVYLYRSYRVDPYLQMETSYSEQDAQELEDAEGMEGLVPMGFGESLKILKHPQFWTLFLGYFFSLGYGIVIVTNLYKLWEGYIGCSSCHEASYTQWISIFLSIGNAGSNLLAGYLSDLTFRKGLPRMRFMAYYLVFVCVSALFVGVLTLTPSNDLFPQVVYALALMSVGVGWGPCFTLFPTVITDLYGPHNFGITFSYLQFSAAGAAIFVPLMNQWFFELTGDFGYFLLVLSAMLLVSAVVTYITKPRVTL
eukprot:TRINITY_DN1481_c0_g1_i1.p1 TRINITY_DN1481_c0_g1~~TRINITY_DN1481_c0_g1_i1.p1  ORF type:complete len:497 (+),score=154.67 TRINITY_DN1481_c0_g1_i1:56-1492(+)